MRLYIRNAGRLGAAAVATAVGLSVASPVFAATSSDTPFISEIHYDNAGADSGEAVEIEAPVGFDLTGWQVVLYNGTGGAVYNTKTLSGVVPAAGVVVQDYPADGIQNGAPDGIALAKPDGTLAEFLSYEGTFTAVGGPANGVLSVDIGVSETSVTAGFSLQKIDGVWQAPAQNSFGARNKVTTPDPDPTPTGCTATVDHTIAEAQGTGDATPLAGTKVTVEGVVTADQRTGGYNGVYIQTVGSGGDRPVAEGKASDGIFVYLGTDQPAVTIGDLVRVTGTLSEFGTLTELTAAKADVQVCKTGVALPAPVPLTLPLSDAARESAESMLVAPAGAYTISDLYNTNRYGEIILAAGEKPAPVPTDVARPGSPEALQVKADNKLRRILLDDGKTTNLATAKIDPPYFTKDHPIRVGDQVAAFGPTVLSYGFSEWRLQPTTPVSFDTPAAGRTTFKATNPRTSGPVDVGGDIKLASFNVLNYFVHFGGDARGAADAAALAKQQAKIVAAITSLHADVVALMEIENSVKFEADDPQKALKTLVGALNAVDGADTWDYVRTPAELPSAAEQDVITTAIIYKPSKVTPKGAARSINDESVWFNAREPIAQTFTSGTITFTVVANHLKSKGTSVAPTGDNVDTGDGQGAYNGDRIREATSLATFVDKVKADSGTDKVLLLGDFNSYTQEDPLQVLYAKGYEDVHTTRAPGKASYVFGGESGSLDHALATPSLAKRVTGVDIWNINSVESFAYEYDGYAPFYSDLPYRASDHDPVVIGLKTGLTEPVNLQLLSINDFHGRLEAPTAGVGGAAQLVGLVNQLRAQNPNTAFVSDGDNIGASTFISAIDNDNPTIDALNAGGLNVSAVGNHEFDKGLDDLVNRVVPRAKFPYLGANVYKDDKRVLPAYVVQNVGGVRVAYIGVVTSQTGSLVSPDGIKGVEFRDPVAEANKVAKQLHDAGDADVIVLLAHEGAAAENITSVEGLQNDAVFGDFTRLTADIDAIFSGHTHQAYAFEVPVPGTDKTRPVIQAEDYGVKLGKATLTYDPATHSVTSSTAELLPVTGITPDPAVATIVANAKTNAAELGKKVLGKITADITRAVTATGGEDRGAESVMGNFIADVQLDQTSAAGRGGAQIALMNPGGLRNDLKFGTDGTITYADAFAVQPFANDVVTQTLTGAQIKQALEEQWQPAGASRPILHLGVSKGLTYSYDAKQAQGSRIIPSSLKLNGVVIDPLGKYRVTTNSFLAAGGDNFATLAKGTDRKTTGDNDLTMLVNYFAAHSPITADKVFRSTPGILDVTAPTGTYTVTPAAIWPGQTVTLTETALSDDVSPTSAITRVITWGDGSAPQTLAAGTTKATHTYAAVGAFQVSVALTDEAGNKATVTPSPLSVVTQPGKFTVDKTAIWATQSVTLHLSGLTGATKVAIAWGDGSGADTSPNVSAVTHIYTKPGTFKVTVTPSNEAGTGKPVVAGSVKVTKDTVKPTVSLTVPKSPTKASSWSKLTGKTADTGLGVASVRVKLIEQRAGKWYYYNGSSWVKASSQSAASSKAKVLIVTPVKGAWSTSVKGVKKGTLKVTYWAVDKAGNTAAAKTYTAKITK